MVTALPAHADTIDPGAAAQQFYALINSERAAAGVPALAWRDDIAAMAVAHSADMAAQGTIWHGSFVSEGNLKALNASLLAENVGMGGDVMSIHTAFMNSPHHRENILDPGLNQVGTGVVIGGDGTVYVTEDFLHSKSAGTAAAAPAPAAPRPAAPRLSTAAAPKPVTPRVAAAHPVAAVAKPAPVTTPATTATTVPAPVGVVNAVPFPAAPAAAATTAPGVLSNVLDGDIGMWITMFGVLLLVFAVSGPAALRRRRLA
ncbi:MAG: CAP domain-containing protein [Acidimicrobiia bacterium]|nr:CAP domain-containing protein [Acidimicrobiia bacterium]